MNTLNVEKEIKKELIINNTKLLKQVEENVKDKLANLAKETVMRCVNQNKMIMFYRYISEVREFNDIIIVRGSLEYEETNSKYADGQSATEVYVAKIVSKESGVENYIKDEEIKENKAKALKISNPKPKKVYRTEFDESEFFEDDDDEELISKTYEVNDDDNDVDEGEVNEYVNGLPNYYNRYLQHDEGEYIIERPKVTKQKIADQILSSIAEKFSEGRDKQISDIVFGIDDKDKEDEDE